MIAREHRVHHTDRFFAASLAHIPTTDTWSVGGTILFPDPEKCPPTPAAGHPGTARTDPANC
jgi:hypothetical protein